MRNALKRKKFDTIPGMIDLLFYITIFALVVLTYNTFVFLLSVFKKDNSIMDIAYGPAFLVGAVGSLLITGNYNLISYLMLALISAWSLRLSIRIFKKNRHKPEDLRYANWREKWSKKGKGYFYLRSYLQIYILQGSIIVLIALPFIISLTNPSAKLNWWVFIGIAISVLGLLYESLADWQLDKFLARKKSGTETATLMTTGLFRFSRRPNYFGETLVWWGLAIAVLPTTFGFMALVSPLLITYIVTKVTGPMLEKIFLKNYPTEYEAYMKQTNYFVPWFPKT